MSSSAACQLGLRNTSVHAPIRPLAGLGQVQNSRSTGGDVIGSPVFNPTKKRRIALLASSTRSPSDFVWPGFAPRAALQRTAAGTRFLLI